MTKNELEILKAKVLKEIDVDLMSLYLSKEVGAGYRMCGSVVEQYFDFLIEDAEEEEKNTITSLSEA